ncbi:MAG: hypothetical protein PHV18_15610 [Lachnospiraceae bacterium]|nr:hypothetical protein [Lachnospiraceae bacterium]
MHPCPWLFLQDNLYALRGFISAIYSIDPDTIESILVKNPFLLVTTTQEDIKMIAENNNYMKSTRVTLQELTAGEQIKLAAETRLRNESDLNSNYSAGVKNARAELLPVIESQDAALKALLEQKNN